VSHALTSLEEHGEQFLDGVLRERIVAEEKAGSATEDEAVPAVQISDLGR